MALGSVMLDVAGMTLTQEEREVLAHPQVGGVILFSRNYDNPLQLIELNRQIRECKNEILIAVDHEGGRVQRFRSGVTRIPSMHTLAQSAPDLISATATLMAQELMALGLDFTFAPVLDRFNPQSNVIGDRAFSECPKEVVQHAGHFITGLAAAGMAAVGKHFPGHGGVVGDTHLEVAIDERDFDEIKATDLYPFIDLAPKLQGMMPAHVVFPCVSDSPVGFSADWLQGVLRDTLQFSGAIFSDDLSMEAAKVAGSPVERGIAAMEAGCSMVLLCNQPDDAIQLIEGFECANIRAQELLIRKLSAVKARAQQGFNWQALQRSQQWLSTYQALQKINERH